MARRWNERPWKKLSAPRTLMEKFLSYNTKESFRSTIHRIANATQPRFVHRIFILNFVWPIILF
jgi:hypothetical protein